MVLSSSNAVVFVVLAAVSTISCIIYWVCDWKQRKKRLNKKFIAAATTLNFGYCLTLLSLPPPPTPLHKHTHKTPIQLKVNTSNCLLGMTYLFIFLPIWKNEKEGFDLIDGVTAYLPLWTLYL